MLGKREATGAEADVAQASGTVRVRGAKLSVMGCTRTPTTRVRSTVQQKLGAAVAPRDAVVDLGSGKSSEEGRGKMWPHRRSPLQGVVLSSLG